MNYLNLACPAADSTALTATTAGTGRVALGVDARRSALLVYNPTATLARVKVGDNTVTATATSFPIPAGEMQPIHTRDATHITAWCASGTVGLEVFALGGM